jgi:DNA-binding NtrC family response regulator
MKKVKILVVDDEAIVRESLGDWLTDVGYQVLTAENGHKALEVIEKEKPGIMITDLVMPGMDGIELMKRAKAQQPKIEVIIITAYASIPTAITAMKEGAYDYIEKPFCPERAELLVEKLAEHQELVEENLSLRQRLEDRYRFENIIAKSSKMQRVIEVIKVVAKSNATVLITGESGTGKELVARALHSQSHRRNKPFVAVSCAALPESLLESELFGHEKGSFTGAYAQKKGKFEFANGGTLSLDEVGEMSANIQVHLLRVLEEKEFTRVGGNEPVRVDVRVISATNKDLRKAIEKQEFREDLYYRLNVSLQWRIRKRSPGSLPRQWSLCLIMTGRAMSVSWKMLLNGQSSWLRIALSLLLTCLRKICRWLIQLRQGKTLKKWRKATSGIFSVKPARTTVRQLEFWESVE